MTTLPEGLAAFGKPATLLHPRAADPDDPASPGSRDSHVGGPLLWPADEPWPTCREIYMVCVETPVAQPLVDKLAKADKGSALQLEAMSELAATTPGFSALSTTEQGVFAIGYVPKPHPAPNAMVAVAQLCASDFPDLPYPEGTDLLQVLWCPVDHRDHWGPHPKLVWRNASEVGDVLDKPPSPEVSDDEHYLPKPCVLDLEQRIDYPWWQELPRNLRWQVRELGETSIGRGWKAGGFASWAVTDLLPMDCPDCDTRMNLLFTIASGDGDADVQVGRFGSMRIFICPDCPDAEPGIDIQ